MLQDASFGGPEREIDFDGSGFDGMDIETHRRAAAGRDVDRPVLLPTGAAELASAQFAVETHQANR